MKLGVVAVVLGLALLGQLACGTPTVSAPGTVLVELNRERLRDDEMRVTTSVFSRSYRVRSDDITITAQGDLSKLQTVDAIVRAWEGPLNFAVLLAPGEDHDLEQFIVKSSTNFKKYVTVHTVQAAKTREMYPINKMRNVALADVTTEWIFALDSDELPVGKMSRFKKEIGQSSPAFPLTTAFAVASFQWKEVSNTIPQSFTELQALLNSGSACVKHPDFPPAYTPPGISLERWAFATEAMKMTYADRYEPYFIVRASNMIPFDERFHGRGGNKVTQEMDMALSGFHFALLPHVFTFTDETRSQVDPSFKDENDALTNQVYKEIGQRHGCDGCERYNCATTCSKLLS